MGRGECRRRLMGTIGLDAVGEGDVGRIVGVSSTKKSDHN